MSFGLQVFNEKEKLTLDSNDYTVRMIVQTITNFGSIGWNSYVDVPLADVKPGMSTIVCSTRDYTNASTLKNSSSNGDFLNPNRPRSLPHSVAFTGFVRLYGQGISPDGFTRNEFINTPYRTNDKLYKCEWVTKTRQVRVNRPKYECWNETKLRYVCENQYNPRTGRWENVCAYKNVQERVCGYKDNWVWESESYQERECNWVDNWIWKDSWSWSTSRGTTSTIEGNVIIQVFTNV
jgi:hypothetical protein